MQEARPLLSIEEVKAIVDRITYKPNWSIRTYIRHDLGKILQVIFEYETINANGSDGRIHLESRILISQNEIEHGFHYRNEKEFIRHIFNIIEGIEQHESHEWFKIDGRQVYETH